MGQMDIRKLDTGDLFPTIDMTVLGRDRIIIPNDVHGQWSAIIFYRGYF